VNAGLARRALPFFLALTLATTTAERTAFANDPATAQTLFDQARKLMAQEKWAEACPKLEESQRLDPGGGTLLHLALCREHEGKIATAWATYQDALANAKRDNRKDRAKIAQARIDVLEKRLPKLKIRVSSKNRKIPGFKISRDELSVGEAQWGESFPVDPGTRTITARADGYKSWTSNVEIPIASQETIVEVPDLEAEPSAAPPGPAPGVVETPHVTPSSPPPPPNVDRPRKDPESDGSGDTQRTAGFIVGGIGVLGITVGSVFGFMSIAKQSEADEKCKAPDFKVCNRSGIATGEDADTLGNISTIAFIGGGLFAVGGAILYFTAPSAPPSKAATTPRITPMVGAQGGGLSLRGSF